MFDDVDPEEINRIVAKRFGDLTVTRISAIDGCARGLEVPEHASQSRIDGSGKPNRGSDGSTIRDGIY